MGELSGHREPAEPRPAPGPAERVVPGPGQESVWDYPRPPRVEAVPERLRVLVDGEVLADTTRGYRVLETAGAPVYYFPPADVRMDRLALSPHHSVRDYLAFYGGRVDEAWVGDERATPQPGRFYGGWVTSRIVGPIKGEPGSHGW